jgi:hypothetical protein
MAFKRCISVSLMVSSAALKGGTHWEGSKDFAHIHGTLFLTLERSTNVPPSMLITVFIRLAGNGNGFELEVSRRIVAGVLSSIQRLNYSYTHHGPFDLYHPPLFFCPRESLVIYMDKTENPLCRRYQLMQIDFYFVFDRQRKGAPLDCSSLSVAFYNISKVACPLLYICK